MKSRIIALATLCFGLLVWAVPASAGGYASVHVDSVPVEIFVDSTSDIRVPCLAARRHADQSRPCLFRSDQPWRHSTN